ncbi:MAG: hypothetical protein IJ773_07135 [Lachnospiraceae bacterium]|nr:hypothetical protein [Lachnospiraceae bacterium]
MNKEKTLKKSAGAYLGIVVEVLALISLILYLTYTTSADGLFMPWVVVCLLLILALEGILFFFDNDIIPILVAALGAAAFGCFAMDPPETIGSVVDYFQNIVMFGNPEKFGIIIALAVLMLLMTLLAIIACFPERVKKG